MTSAVIHPDGRLIMNGQTWRAALGRAGVTAHKMEGDGATPLGLLPLRRILYRADRLRPPKTVVPIEPLAPHDGWCDAPFDSQYNRMVTLPYNARHEELWRADGLYDVIGVLGWNDAPVHRNCGSAIFLHVATRDYAPTAGCIALGAPDLLALLACGLDGIDVRS